MLVVVADTSPLNYLTLIDAIDLLPKLFDKVLIPAAVFDELSEKGTPAVVRTWIAQVPSWLEVKQNPVSSDEAIASTLDEGSSRPLHLPRLPAPI